MTSDNLGQAEREVMRAVVEHAPPYSPDQLVDELRHKGFDEDRVRAAIWSLIDLADIGVTPDGRLTSSPQP